MARIIVDLEADLRSTIHIVLMLIIIIINKSIRALFPTSFQPPRYICIFIIVVEMMSPHTALSLQESKKNQMKDFLNVIITI